MTPRPINATLAMLPPRSCRAACGCGAYMSGKSIEPIRHRLYCAGRTPEQPQTTMAPTKQQVLDNLAKIAGPDGAPLTSSGKLSDVMVTDGKVFFSITVDATAVQAWESVRDRAEAAARAVPGVESALVALTA